MKPLKPKVGDMLVMLKPRTLGFDDIPPNQICRILERDPKYLSDTSNHLGAYLCEMVFYPEITFTTFIAMDVSNGIIKKI